MAVGGHRHGMPCMVPTTNLNSQPNFWLFSMHESKIATGNAACKRNPASSSHVHVGSNANTLFTSCMRACQTSLIPRSSHHPVLKRTHFMHTFFILNQERHIFAQRLKLQHLGQKLQEKASSSFFQSRIAPPLCLPTL